LGRHLLLNGHLDVFPAGDPAAWRDDPFSGTVRGGKGLLWIDLLVKTHGGHDGMPHVSPHAITVSGPIIRDLAELGALPIAAPRDVAQRLAVAAPVLDDMLGAGAAEALTHVTVSTGTIAGGLKVNLIAPSCRTAIDLRCPIGVPTEEILGAFERVVQRYRATSDVTNIVINRTEPSYCAPDHSMVGIIQANSERACGIRPVPSISLQGRAR
jgi:succinyl-diaminopimelate desuccinylase